MYSEKTLTSVGVVKAFKNNILKELETTLSIFLLNIANANSDIYFLVNCVAFGGISLVLLCILFLLDGHAYWLRLM